jgi:hypothetical protein
MLEDLGVAHADPHRLRGLLDGARLKEAKLEYAAVAIGQGGKDPSGTLRGIARLF